MNFYQKAFSFTLCADNLTTSYNFE